MAVVLPEATDTCIEYPAGLDERLGDERRKAVDESTGDKGGKYRGNSFSLRETVPRLAGSVGVHR